MLLPNGIRHLPGYLDRPAQEALVGAIRAVVTEAPLFTPVMPGTGKEMSVRITNCGPLGWVTDKQRGYRYQGAHPLTGKPWPAMPSQLLDLWSDIAGYEKSPEACLVNFYADDARMGLHQDRDEQDFAAPVVSISLGNTCLFRVGGLSRNDRTLSFKLSSGDIVVLGGEGRLCFHGVDRIYPATSTLLKNGGRINLTLRRVN
ncbi:MAG: alpha-ketoglutarate-dependent dioxygenase AlkB [Rhizobiaceae bacterium]|nr:alpha-ketoglutarate-dependent dioxygenase AlkB [Rhizobiaceae bacterium]